jgi:outer membrane protein assembly factor BamC
MKNKFLTELILCLLAVSAIAGCKSVDEKRKIDYGYTKTLPPLEVPPDLTAISDSQHPAESASYSKLAAGSSSDNRQTSAVLPEFSGMSIARDGQQRWLVVKLSPEVLWPQVRDFLVKTGLKISKENSSTGVIETDWAENRGENNDSALARWFASMNLSGVRDRYRIRLERGATAGNTEIYLAHRGMKLVSVGDNSLGWEYRPSDSELEAEMLRMLMVHLGANEKQAVAQVKESIQETQDQPRAALRRNGQDQLSLNLQDSLDRAWRRVGLSLDRIGFTVEDRDRSKGLYYVRYVDPETVEPKRGFFSRLFGGSDDPQPQSQYLIRLESASAGTEVEVLSKDGVPEASKTGERILSLLYDQLK